MSKNVKVNLWPPFKRSGTNILSRTANDTLQFLGGASYNPIHIGTKSNSADQGLILTGITDDTGGVMVFCDDGNDTLSSITSPIWTRYLLTKDQGTGGPTTTGAFFQSKSLDGLTFTTGSYTAMKSYYQIGGALTLAGSSTELAIINAGLTLEGNVVVGSGNRFSGIDVNISDGGNSKTITDTALDTAGIHIRKVASSTLTWPVGIKINDGGATTGVRIGTCATAALIAEDSAVQMGTATTDCSTFTMIKGAQTSDPQVQFALSADANGNFSITADTGDITLTAADDFFVSVDGNIELALTGTALYPQTDGGLTLGITNTNEWGGLYMNAASVIAWDNSDVTLTHSANTLTIGGGNLVLTQPIVDASTPTALTITGGAHTAITAATEDIGANFNFSATKTWAAGTGPLATQREVVFQAPTYDGNVAGALTITKAATVAITNAPQDGGANITLTNAYALWVQAGLAQFDGGAVFSVTDIAGSNPTLNFYDTDCADYEISASIDAQATDTLTTQEDVDVTFKQKIAGTLTAFLTADADGNITLGSATQPVVVTGDLTVNGTTTIINATTITVDDKNIELGSVASPDDTTADGGGITLKGATDKTILWDNTNDNWTSNQAWNIASGLDYKINNVSVLNATTLGTSVVASSLTSVGTLTSLTTTGAITQAPIAAGNLYDMQLGTEWTSGTLFNADFAGATVQSGDMKGIVLNFNTNLAGVTDLDITGYQVKTSALTQSTANTTNYIGYDLPTAGALIQNTLVGIINWKGFNIQMPNITATTGTVNSYGISITGGTVTSGTQYAINTSNCSSILTLGATNNLYLDASTTDHTDTAGVIDINLDTATADVTGINVATIMTADVAGVSGIASSITGFSTGHATGSELPAFKATLVGDNNDTDVYYTAFSASDASKNGGTSEMEAFFCGTGYDYSLLADSGAVAFYQHAGVIKGIREANGAGDNLTIQAADGYDSAAVARNGGILNLYGGAKKNAGNDGYVKIGQAATNASHTLSDDDANIVGMLAVGGGMELNVTTIDATTLTFTPAFLTGDIGAESTAATWAALTNTGKFKITIDGTLYTINPDFTGDASMADVAASIQTAIRTATSTLETCIWSTDHFVISSVDTTSTSAITVTSAPDDGTDISGAGLSDWMDADTANGVVTGKAVGTYTLLVTDNILSVSAPTTDATYITLPTAQLISGRVITIKDASGNAGTKNITVSTQGAEDIDGADTKIIASHYGALSLYSNGSHWFISHSIGTIN